MYRVLIADDEKLIRMGLRSIINWKGMGFDIVGEAANGRETKEFMISEKPDLCLIDIRMPGVHGLDALKEARDAGFTGKVIVLSGYSDFEYAQTAIQYGVVSYLTKPVDVEKLREILLKVRDELDSESRAEQSRNKYISTIRTKVIEDLLTGKVDADSINIDEVGLSAGPFRVLITEKYSKDSEAIAYSFADILRVANDDGSAYDSVRIDSRECILLKGQKTVDKFRELEDKFFLDLPPEKNSPLDTLFVASGPVVESASDIVLSYNEARFYMEHRFFCDKGQHISSAENPPSGGEHITSQNIEAGVSNDSAEKVKLRAGLLQKYTDSLVESVQTFNRNKIAESLSLLKESLNEAPLSVEDEKNFLVDLYLKIRERLLILYSRNEIHFIENSEAISFIMKSDYLYEILKFLSEQFDMIMTAIGYSSRDSIIDDVIFYIEHNYSSNITLENLAPLFGYNSSYLGKIFSRKKGVNFNTYLDNVRIEHSKEILLSGKTQVYKVAEMVGYKNVDYFHIKFKKYTNMSPAEYRKKMTGQNIPKEDQTNEIQ